MGIREGTRLGSRTPTGLTYKECATLMGLKSHQQVVEIEKRALRKIKYALECEAAGEGKTVSEMLYGDLDRLQKELRDIVGGAKRLMGKEECELTPGFMAPSTRS